MSQSGSFTSRLSDGNVPGSQSRLLRAVGNPSVAALAGDCGAGLTNFGVNPPKQENSLTASQSLLRLGSASPEEFSKLRGHRDEIRALDFHPNLPQIISGSKDGSLMRWNYLEAKNRALRFEGHRSPVNDVAFNGSGDLMVSASDDATLRLWVPTHRGDSRVFHAHHSSVRSVDWSPNSEELASASDDKSVKLWSIGKSVLPSSTPKSNVAVRRFTASYACHKNWVRSVRYHPEGTILCTTSDDGTVGVIDKRSKAAAFLIKVRDGMPTYAEFNPSGHTYIGVAAGRNFNVYDVRTRSRVQLYVDIHLEPVRKFVFHPSGDFVYTVSADKTIKILDIVEGRPIHTLTGPTDAVSTVACSKDGKYFATGGLDKTISIWKPFLLPYSQVELEQMDLSPDSNVEDHLLVETNEAEQGGRTLDNDEVPVPGFPQNQGEGQGQSPV